jgi:nuclear transport factor 2 (NTF2) superfamily protein
MVAEVPIIAAIIAATSTTTQIARDSIGIWYLRWKRVSALTLLVALAAKNLQVSAVGFPARLSRPRRRAARSECVLSVRRWEAAMSPRPPLPPFTRETAIQKIRLAEDAWNTRDPEKVSLAYTVDSRWRNRSEFLNGRAEIVAFLKRKWAAELDYRLIKELWAFDTNRIAVRFAYEFHDQGGNWFRAYGNENWEFDADGLMQIRHASINDVPIPESARKYHWPLGRRPDSHPSLSELGL